MIIHCPECQSDHAQLTGQTEHWIDADGDWNYHIAECLDCGAFMWIDHKGFPHLTANPPKVDARYTVKLSDYLSG